jgi:glycosyltransferase involved in cell wall biosynthesis
MQGGLGWIAGVEYVKNIALALGSLPKDIRSTFELSLLCSKNLNADIQDQVKPYLDKLFFEEEYLRPQTFFNRVRWKIMSTVTGQTNPRLDRFLRKQSIEFVYPYLSENSPKQPYRSAECIFDFQHKYLTHLFSQEEIQNRDHWFTKVASSCSEIVLNSKSAQADFHHFFPDNTHKTRVISFKTVPLSQWFEGDPQSIQSKYFLPDKFFLISNQFWQHKNYPIVFEALKLLRKKSIYPIVVCTGHIYDFRKPEYSDIILQKIHESGVANQVCLMGLVPKFDQVQLMRRSIAVIQPSLFEGWSSLVEDARLLGKPMILSNLPVHLEQNPPHSVFFDVNSPESLAELLGDWWECCQPGPDLEKELTAMNNAQKEVQDFGCRFLKLAKGFL